MSITHRLRLALAVMCLWAARTPMRPRDGWALLQQAALEEAWHVPIAVMGGALLLGLVLIAARHRELALEQAQWLRDALIRSDARRAWRVQTVWSATPATPIAELERQLAARPSTLFAPPTPGVGGQFLVMLFAHVAVFAIAIANYASEAPPAGRGLTILVLLGLALAGSVLASVVSAVSMALLPRSLAGVAILCGALTLAMAANALPPLGERALSTIVVATMLSAILTGGFHQVKRRPPPQRRRGRTPARTTPVRL